MHKRKQRKKFSEKCLRNEKGYAIIAYAKARHGCREENCIYGGVAQLGERHTGSVEVIGSIPTVSTIKAKTAGENAVYFLCLFFLDL